MKKKVVITISARWDCNYNVRLDVDESIYDDDATIKDKMLKLCIWLSVLDVWSVANGYIGSIYGAVYELSHTLHDFLYSDAFNHCVYKYLDIECVDIVKI